MRENLERIKIVANGLKPLQEEIFFVGGAVVSFYADNIELFSHRSTDDIDVIVEILSRGKYILLQERLRALGFHEDAGTQVTCRWKYHGITVDIMPLNEEILGFSNKWYADGIKHSMEIEIDSNLKISIFKFPYFIASKFEALANRNVNWRYSKDFEDIIKTLEARNDSVKEIEQSDRSVRIYLQEKAEELLSDRGFLTEAIGAVLYPDFDHERIQSIVAKLEQITVLK